MSTELLEDLVRKLEALRVGQVGAVMLKFHGKVIYALAPPTSHPQSPPPLPYSNSQTS